jgi:predicted oxidoreductase (fatty acid repression mutant protein)
MLVKEGMGKAEVKIVLGTADSVVAMMPVEDVYTNKLIKMEAWHYGKDTVLLFANDKLVKGLKN